MIEEKLKSYSIIVTCCVCACKVCMWCVRASVHVYVRACVCARVYVCLGAGYVFSGCGCECMHVCMKP